jgi:serine/threonine-protein kinase ULK/ATG1
MSKTVGDYQIKERIGKGSFAEVYLGTNLVDGKRYAIKVISKELMNSEPKLAAGLESEIRIMHEFIHPHIVRLHRYFSSEKNFFLVLDYCQGGDLSKFIRKKGRLSEPAALRFLHQLAEGLHFLKEKNFVHRDLKPANVLLSEFSESATVKLADFGFARYLLEASLAQTRCGTPLYMVS